jgi:hypothetical protein
MLQDNTPLLRLSSYLLDTALGGTSSIGNSLPDRGVLERTVSGQDVQHEMKIAFSISVSSN